LIFVIPRYYYLFIFCSNWKDGICVLHLFKYCIYLNINKYQSYRYILKLNNKLTTYQWYCMFTHAHPPLPQVTDIFIFNLSLCIIERCIYPLNYWNMREFFTHLYMSIYIYKYMYIYIHIYIIIIRYFRYFKNYLKLILLCKIFIYIYNISVIYYVSFSLILKYLYKFIFF